MGSIVTSHTQEGEGVSDKGVRNKEEELGSRGEMKDLLLSHRLAG